MDIQFEILLKNNIKEYIIIGIDFTQTYNYYKDHMQREYVYGLNISNIYYSVHLISF